jgi:hypothetical protein
MVETDELILQVARHLTGVRVVIRWKEPEDVNALGQVYRGEGGTAYLDVCDYLSLETKWDIFLHELAHIKLGHHLLSSPGSYKSPAGSSKRTPDERSRWSGSSYENDANMLAKRWNEYAEYHGREYPGYLTGIQQRLNALLHY